MLDGSDFVEAVVRLGYPGGSELKGQDFDWLFGAPEHQWFLRFFCGSLNRSNVLTPEQMRAFSQLRDSGKPILDEAELAEVLKTCQATPASSVRMEEVDVTQLEEELRALRAERKLKLQRYRQLQVMTTARSDAALRLVSRHEEASCHLKDTVAGLRAENAETNAALQRLSEEAGQLASFLGTKPTPLEQGEQATAPVRGPPVFLSQLTMEAYLHQEEANTKALALLTQKQFFQGISDMVNGSSGENFQLLDLSCCGEDGEGAVAARKTEMARLQWAHIVAQHQLLLARAKEHSTRAGLQWIRENLPSKTKRATSVLALQASGEVLTRELQRSQAELEALLQHRMPGTLRESARMLNMPVVQGNLDLQMARQDYYTSRQDQVCAYLLRQKASFELLLLGHELELRKERQLHQQLGELACRLEGASAELGQRLHTFSQPELALVPRPCTTIGSRDSAFSRLYKALESGKGTAAELEQPFRTFEGLEQVAQGLQEELRLAREALAGAAQEQALVAAQLEADCDVLRGAAYSGLQQPVLTPQVRVAAGQELCPNSQELRGKLQDQESQLESLNRLMKEILVDIRGKRGQLERSPTLRRERDLYVHFHLDVQLLRRAVEELESMAGVASLGRDAA